MHAKPPKESAARIRLESIEVSAEWVSSCAWWVASGGFSPWERAEAGGASHGTPPCYSEGAMDSAGANGALGATRRADRRCPQLGKKGAVSLFKHSWRAARNVKLPAARPGVERGRIRNCGTA